MRIPFSSFRDVCRPGSGAGAFFASILVWGVGMGCFGAVFNNFLVETYGISGLQRGTLEFLRETPGVMLVAILAALHRFSDWKVLRVGTACSLLAALLLAVPVPLVPSMTPSAVTMAESPTQRRPIAVTARVGIAAAGRSEKTMARDSRTDVSLRVLFMGETS